MTQTSRLTIRTKGPDPRGAVLLAEARALGVTGLTRVDVADVVFFGQSLSEHHRQALVDLLVDPLVSEGDWRVPSGGVESSPLPGGASPTTEVVRSALAIVGLPDMAVATGTRFELTGSLDSNQRRTLATRLLSNPTIERWSDGPLEPDFAIGDTAIGDAASGDGEHISHDHFDTFAARITLDDGTELAPLSQQLRECTERIASPAVRTAFGFGAGTVSFHPGVSIAVSARSGHAIGDVLAAAHQPVAVTDVLCFGPTDLAPQQLPEGAQHPLLVERAVVTGLSARSNAIGVPTVAGAVLYDPAFTRNPLVFSACIGVAQEAPSAIDPPPTHGHPQHSLAAAAPTPLRTAHHTPVDYSPSDTLIDLLAHPTIASKERVIRRFNHEHGGATLVRPLVGRARDAHADGVVIAAPTDQHGIAIGIGVNPWFALLDPERMAHACVDEAIRNVVAVGGDPDKVALLANFSWGDPHRPHTFGELVMAVRGCCDAAERHRAPFLSISTSLDDEHLAANGQHTAAPATLAITAIAHISDVERVCTPQLTQPGNVLVHVGRVANEFGGSHFAMVHSIPLASSGIVPAPDQHAPTRYRRIHEAITAGTVRACHDISEGGLAIAIAEMCIAGRFGASIEQLPHPDPTVALFAESTGRFVCEVPSTDLASFLELMDGDATLLGYVTATRVLTMPGVSLRVDELVTAFNGGSR